MISGIHVASKSTLMMHNNFLCIWRLPWNRNVE